MQCPIFLFLVQIRCTFWLGCRIKNATQLRRQIKGNANPCRLIHNLIIYHILNLLALTNDYMKRVDFALASEGILRNECYRIEDGKAYEFYKQHNFLIFLN